MNPLYPRAVETLGLPGEWHSEAGTYMAQPTPTQGVAVWKPGNTDYLLLQVFPMLGDRDLFDSWLSYPLDDTRRADCPLMALAIIYHLLETEVT